MTPLRLTRIDLSNYNQLHFKDGGVFVGDPSSFDSLLWFWNTRCSGIPLEFLAECDIERYRPYIQSSIDDFNGRITESPTRDPFFTFYHLGLSKGRLSEISESFSGTIRWVNYDLSMCSLSKLLHSLPSDSLSYDTALGTVDTDKVSPTVTLILPEKKFLPDTDRNIAAQSIAVSVKEHRNYAYLGHTLEPPHLPELNEFYSREICFDPYKLRSEQGGIGLLTDLRSTYEILQPIDHSDLFRQMFKLADIESDTSQAGRLAQKIIDRVESLNGCRLSNWLNLKEIDDQWTCDYCGQSNLTSVQLKHRGDWKFRRSGLFGRDNNQEGAISVLLTLMLFNHVVALGDALCVPSMNLRIAGEQLETDFVFMRYKEDYGGIRIYGGMGIEIAIGECKDEGGTIDLRDIDKLMKARASLEALGLRCYLVFSKTSNAFTNEELEIFRGLNAESTPVILFTNEELEPLNPYWEPGYAADLPYDHPTTCSELAANSVARYLKS